MKHILFFAALLVFSSNGSAQSLVDSLTQQLTAIQQASILSGFGVAIITQEDILYEQGFGYADIANKTLYTPQSVHNIGSVSKTFIGVSIMQLVEEGKLSLDTKINDILPFRVVHPRFPNADITVQHLATHTSGIRDARIYGFGTYILEDDWAEIKDELRGMAKLQARIIRKNKMQALSDFLKDYFTTDGQFYKRKNFTKTEPGTHYEYSNIASGLAAYVVELVSGQPYDEYVRTNILKPLNMQDSAWKYEDIEGAKLASTYHPKGAKFPRYSLITYPDGGLRTCMHDLSRYTQEMMRGYDGKSDFLKAESFQTMMDSHFKDEDEGAGIFWAINRRGYIGHNGADPGIFTMIEFVPEEKIGFVLMTNCSAHTNKKSFASIIEVWRAIRTYARKMIATEE